MVRLRYTHPGHGSFLTTPGATLVFQGLRHDIHSFVAAKSTSPVENWPRPPPQASVRPPPAHVDAANRAAIT